MHKEVNSMHYDEETKVHYRVFGYTEFVDYCLSTPATVSGDDQASKRDESGKETPWSGTETFDQAVQYAKHGWDAGLESLKDYVETESTLINVENSLVGHAVDVGRFLTGVPDSMVSFYDDAYRNKAPLTVYIQLSYNAGNSGEKAMKYCGLILDTVAMLNRTFNVALVGAFPAAHGPVKDAVMVRIKDTDDRFVMNNLAFSFNPAFFRRFWFKWLETTNLWEPGYGTTIEQWDKGPVNNLMRKIVPPSEQCVFLPNIYNMDKFDPVAIVKQEVEKQLTHNNR